MEDTLKPDPLNDTIDAFHRGAFFLVQPKQKGHRCGMDAMVLAACVPTEFQGRVADLGSGAGGAGLAVASRCPGARITLVEQCPLMCSYAEKTLALAENACLRPRLNVLQADVSTQGSARLQMGLLDNSFDFVIMNPPFNQTRDRSSADPIRAKAHVMPENMFMHWLKTSCAILKAKGRLALIARPSSLPEILYACEKKFGNIALTPLCPTAETPAIRLVITATKSSRAPLKICPPLVLHNTSTPRLTARAEAIINGRAPLFGP